MTFDIEVEMNSGLPNMDELPGNTITSVLIFTLHLKLMITQFMY